MYFLARTGSRFLLSGEILLTFEGVKGRWGKITQYTFQRGEKRGMMVKNTEKDGKKCVFLVKFTQF